MLALGVVVHRKILMTQFTDLGLDAPILKALDSEGYTTPTPIQAQAIPAVLEAKDLLGIAQTGTGKTAAFALPVLHRLHTNPQRAPKKGCRALVLSPTRELASQIAESFKKYSKNLNVTVSTVFGGVGYRKQEQMLSKGVDVLIATPGRLQDHMASGKVNLSGTELFVLDEADQMLDLGFLTPIKQIVSKLSSKRQMLFFSATMPKEISKLANSFLRDPVKVTVTPAATTVERIAQNVVHIEKKKKVALLGEVLSGDSIFRALVFTRTKRGADRVAKHLTTMDFAATAIHGNKSQSQREKALNAFKKSKIQILVATDIAARGIDVSDVTHVVNYDLPEVPDAYVHRIGRTARAGASGRAISFCAPDEKHLLRAIEKVTRQKIASEDRRNDESLPVIRDAQKERDTRDRNMRDRKPNKQKADRKRTRPQAEDARGDSKKRNNNKKRADNDQGQSDAQQFRGQRSGRPTEKSGEKQSSKWGASKHKPRANGKKPARNSGEKRTETDFRKASGKDGAKRKNSSATGYKTGNKKRHKPKTQGHGHSASAASRSGGNGGNGTRKRSRKRPSHSMSAA